MNENMINEETMGGCESTGTNVSSFGGKLIGGALLVGGIYAAYKLVKKIASKKKMEYVESSSDSEGDVIDADVVEELNKKLN